MPIAPPTSRIRTSAVRRLLGAGISAVSLTAAAASVWAPSTRAQSAVTIQVDAAAGRHAIDPRVYGVSWATVDQLRALNAPVNRWGGNRASTYNWEQNSFNKSADWYYESLPEPGTAAGAAADDFVAISRNAGAEPVLALPMLGWVSKLGSSRGRLASFSSTKYGAQQSCDWQGFPTACNGLKSGGAMVTGNDPNDAYTPSSAAQQKRWVQHLVARWGTAAAGGVRYYAYDHQPSLWYKNHRDVRPVGLKMAELRDAMVAYGTAVRQADPGAVLVGPEEWGWLGYFLSGYDQQYRVANNCYDSCHPDRDANGGMDQIPWLLDQLRQHEQATGVRLLDVLSVHAFPTRGEDGTSVTSAMQQRRNRSTRSFWDPGYVDEGWIGQKVNLIPRMKDWVRTYYPGRQIAVTAYSWGAERHINGATAQADLLGIFGREGLDMAVRWTAPAADAVTFKAMQMYRNYDGALSTFGDTSVRATVPNADSLAAFAAVRTSDGALTVMVINKERTSVPVSLSLAGFTPGGAAQVWMLGSSNVIRRGSDLAVASGRISTTLAGPTITLFVVPRATNAAPGLSVGDVSVNEGSGGTTSATFTVSLSAAPAGNASGVTVAYATANGTATAGSDYTATSGTLTFSAGQTTKTVSVPVVGDTTIENDETLTLVLSNPAGATISRATATATIRDDDKPSLAIADASVGEGNSGATSAVLTVTLQPAAPFAVSVNYATANGTAVAGSDYSAQTGSLTFSAGQTSRTISVPITGDTSVEPDETLTVTLGGASGATISRATGTVTVRNDDQTAGVAALAIADASVVEGNSASTNAVFTVTLQPAAATSVSVNYATLNGTASSGSDYTATSGTLTFTAGQTSLTISVPVAGDTAVEADETLFVDLSGASGAAISRARGQGTIVNDDTSGEALLPADRATTWNPGIPGGVPQRTTLCATIDAAAYGNGTSDASSAIQSAINACPVGQVVKLGVGVFRIDASVLQIGRGITLRGSGLGTTFLKRTNGSRPGTYVPVVADPVVVIGPNRWPDSDDSTSQNLAADGAKGAYSVTLASATGFAAGQFVLLDEDHYNTATWQSLPNRNGAATSIKVWASDRVVWQRHSPSQPEDDPFPAAAGWFSRSGRPIAEIKEIASVSGNTVTFTTPLHIGYRVAYRAQVTRYTGGDAHVKGAGIEDLTVQGGGDGNVRFEAAAHCWMKNVENTAWLGEGVAIDNSFRIEVRDSYIHDGVWSEPGGGGYAISFARGSAESLIENNIVMKANKVMVARSSGAGSVIGYNYMDDGFIQSVSGWVEVGINGSHMAGPHHMLFEGNEAFNYDSDNTHGNAVYHTVFRNHLSGFRRTINGTANNRAAGLMFGSWWHSFVGNVMGTSGRMSGWVYEDAGPSWGDDAIWRLGYDPINWGQSADPKVLSTILREGNFDYVTNQVRWSASAKTLPASLYRTAKPAFFGSLPWPWVDPTGTTKLQTLPAKARYDSGNVAGWVVP